ncbi:hypothetical protein [Roseiconus nitratireducens]|uniref:hypothetical protein n=1 Tax=Roseiconus nitratireducens TaxID=2605748 RepID=UPI001F2F6AC9|nr:hypothetical protein [Roseiconus nitratireducens]
MNPAHPICCDRPRFRIFRARGLKWGIGLMILCLPLLPSRGIGQETPSPAQESDLLLRQSGVAERYERLEELLLRLADMEAAENPERSALLRRAAKQSRDKFVLQQLRNASEALRDEKFADAVSNQDSAQKGLAEILKLLTSEDRANRIRDEKKRVAEMIKDLKRIERSQRSTRARTENGSELERLKAEQAALAERGQKLQDELGEEQEGEAEGNSDASDQQSSDEPQTGNADPASDQPPGEANESGDSDESGEPKESGGKEDRPEKNSDDSDAGKPSEQDPSGQPAGQESPNGSDQSQESTPSDSQSGESQPSQQGQPSPSESQPSESQPSESQPSQQGQSGQDSSQQSPTPPPTPQQQAEQQLQKAVERMRQAEQELEDSKRKDAVDQQLAAEENLRKAIDELEQILRQLREEEMQRELARLESRLKKMAAMQSKILDDTASLSATPKSQRNRQTDLKAGDLSFEQKKVTVEADRAMLLLREEGSSVAFPEVVAQIRDDSDRIAQRLGKSQIDAVTQGIQQDVLAAIEEMIQALQQAQRDLEKQKQQGETPPQQPGEPGEQPLVDAIAELKLIRTMETRIKSTTQRYSGLLQSDEGSAQELLPLLKNLSERQSRLYKITRDLVMRRNQ